MSPIKNKRYHCKQCENFDLCENCYIVRLKRHEHKDFDLIDGLEILKKKRDDILKTEQIKNRLSIQKLSLSRLRMS
jgi:hypothetical protein